MKRAFTHVNAVDVLAHKVLADCTVLVKDGKIVEIGQGVDTAGSEVIDLAGKYMTPGLFNCHVHLCSCLLYTSCGEWRRQSSRPTPREPGQRGGAHTAWP